MREIDAVEPPLVPLFHGAHTARQERRGAGRYAAGIRKAALPESRWPQVIADARLLGLRQGREAARREP